MDHFPIRVGRYWPSVLSALRIGARLVAARPVTGVRHAVTTFGGSGNRLDAPSRRIGQEVVDLGLFFQPFKDLGDRDLRLFVFQDLLALFADHGFVHVLDDRRGVPFAQQDDVAGALPACSRR